MGTADVKHNNMATPWADPRTGRYYLRRQIPVPLRPAFGGSPMYKVALGTKNPDEARAPFARENAIFEEKLADARRAIAEGKVAPSPASVVKRWFEAPAANGGLPGRERLQLLLMELDAGIAFALDDDLIGDLPPSHETDWRAIERDREAFEELVALHYQDDPERTGLLWLSTRWHAGEDLWRPLVRAATERLARGDRAAAGHPIEQITDSLLEYLDGVRPNDVEDLRRRLKRQNTPRSTRLRPTMRLRELYKEWKAGNAPRPQTAGEYKAAIEDFIEFANDPPICMIDADLIYDYRDMAAKLPKSMPRADRDLPFRERVAKHEDVELKASPATLKKRIGAIQALLTYAHEQRWTSQNLGRGIQIVGYTKRRRNRRSFEDHELAQLFAYRLFTDIPSWADCRSKYSDLSMFWLFLLATTTGARLEEVGQATLADVREDGDIVYLDIDEYAVEDGAGPKHVKGVDSIRLVPVHRKLIELGFLRYRDALLAAGETQLFPDLKENTVGKRTKEASQRLNRIIDRAVGTDRRLVFHSLRHAFKAKGNDAGLTDRTLDQICGHAPTSTGSRYGSEPRVRTIHRELHTIDFSCIAWQNIAERTKGIDWAAIIARAAKVD